jgi:triacylglycerol lipase
MPNRNGSAPSKRCHIVLVPGFGGFDALGRVNYYAGITGLLQQWTAAYPQPDVVLHYFDNLPTAAVITRAQRLRQYLAKRMARGEIRSQDVIVLVGHSTGGLDIRQLICDLHDRNNEEILVDGGLPVEAETLRRCIKRVVFLSVPHWGTNIAEWVYNRAALRKIVIADLRAAFAGSQVWLLDRIEAGVAGNAAALTDADVLLALRDTLTEANDDWSRDPSRIADALEAASELELYFREMGRDFHVIDDLTPEAHPNEPSPAHFGPDQRADELKLWAKPLIRTLSYATVGGRAFQFDSGSPAPAFNLTNPFEDLGVVRACGTSRDTDISYRLCYRACAGGPLTLPKGAGRIGRVLGPRPPEPLELWDNDGIVNTVSMLWPLDENVLVQADHLDIVGHFRLAPAPKASQPAGPQPPRVYQSYDTLRSSPKFKATTFEAVWNEIFCFAAMPNAYHPNATGLHRPMAVAVAADAEQQPVDH